MKISDEIVQLAHAEYHKVLGDKNRSNPMRAALAASLPKLMVKVKPLEWVRSPDEDCGYVWRAKKPFGSSYHILKRDDGSFRWLDTQGTLEEAKAAAQADYERRMMTGLEIVRADVDVAVKEALKFLLDAQPRIDSNEPFNGDQSKWNDYCDAIHQAIRALSAEPAQE